MAEENLNWLPMTDIGNAAHFAKRCHAASGADLDGFYIHKGRPIPTVIADDPLINAASPEFLAYRDRLCREFGELRCAERKCHGCLRVFDYEGRRHFFTHLRIEPVGKSGDANGVILTVPERLARCSQQCERSPDRLSGLKRAACCSALPDGKAHLAIYRYDFEHRVFGLVSCQLLSPSGSCIPPKVAEAGESETPLPGGGQADD